MNQPTARMTAIDDLRGAAVAGMILVNSQYSEQDSYRQLAHAAWQGWTLADTVFPTFLFIVGVSIAVSFALRMQRGEARFEILRHVALRAAIVLACGIAVDTVQFPVRELPFVALKPHVQLTGVLQEIAVCYLLAAIVYLRTGLAGAIAGAIGLSILYDVLLYRYPVPGCAPGALAVACNFPLYVDGSILKDLRWTLDACDTGLGSLPSTTATVLLGVVAGSLLTSKPRPEAMKLLLIGGLCMIGLGELLSLWVPIIKKIWTPSFVVLMAGISTFALAASVWLSESDTLRRLLRPLEFLGANALTAYVVARLIDPIPRVHIHGWSIHDQLLARITSAANASLIYATLVLALVLAVLAIKARLSSRSGERA